MLALLAAAVILGLTGGFTPGPLLAFVIAQTLRHGAREGIKVAMVPLITDSSIIVLVMLLLRPLAGRTHALGVLSIAGSLYLLYLAYETWRARAPQAGDEPEQPRSIRRGVIVNFLNPNPYIFWLTVGCPTLLKAWRVGWPTTIAFLVILFSLIVGCQMLIAVLVAHSREHVAGRWYVVAMRTLAMLLALFAAVLVRDGVRLVTS